MYIYIYIYIYIHVYLSIYLYVYIYNPKSEPETGNPPPDSSQVATLGVWYRYINFAT